MEIGWIIFFALLGAVIGSFLNVVIDRLPQGQSISYPPSHCNSCQKRLGTKDLIPIISYLWLKGRCRYCGAAITKRILWVEISNAALFAYLFWYFDFGGELAVAAFYGCIFLVLFVIDLERGLLLNKIIYPSAVIALLLSIFASSLEIVPSIGSAAGGGAAGLGLFLAIAIISRGGMGFGDVKMAALIGLAVGWPLVFEAILLAVIGGGLLAVALMLSRAKGRRQSIAFGPFLALGAIATLIHGEAIMDWYLALF